MNEVMKKKKYIAYIRAILYILYTILLVYIYISHMSIYICETHTHNRPTQHTAVYLKYYL